MRVAFARNQVGVATATDDMYFTTEPVAMGNANFVDLALNISTAFFVGGATSIDLDVNVQGSNDWQHWVELFSEKQGAAGIYHKTGEVTTAFLRLEFIASVGTAGWGAVAFDVHANLTRQFKGG